MKPSGTRPRSPDPSSIDGASSDSPGAKRAKQADDGGTQHVKGGVSGRSGGAEDGGSSAVADNNLVTESAATKTTTTSDGDSKSTVTSDDSKEPKVSDFVESNDGAPPRTPRASRSSETDIDAASPMSSEASPPSKEGQRVSIAKLISRVINGYPPETAAKEWLQNADDPGASEFAL